MKKFRNIILEFERAYRTGNKAIFGIYACCNREYEDTTNWSCTASVRARLISPYGSAEKRPNADELFYGTKDNRRNCVEAIHKVDFPNFHE